MSGSRQVRVDFSPPPVLDAALDYLRRGLSVIPVRPRDKKPALKRWEQFQQEPATEEQLQKWFSGNDRNIGIICGPVSGGLVVIDVDDPKLLKRFVKQAGLSGRAPIVSTNNGRGHIYLKSRKAVQSLKHPTTVDGQKVPIDLQAAGSYVLGVPSIHPNGSTYHWMNGQRQPLEVKDAREFMVDVLAGLGIQLGRPAEATQAPPDSLSRTLSGPILEGTRDDTLTRLAGYYRNRLPQDICLATLQSINAAHCEPPLPEGKVEKIVRSIYRYPGQDNEPRELTPETAEEIFRQEIQMPPTLIEGHLRQGELAVVSGHHKVYKSFTVLQMARDIAAGQPFLDRFVVPAEAKVLLVQEEISKPAYGLRIQGMVGDLTPEQRERLLVVNRQGVRIDNPALSDLIEQHKPAVLILDNISAMFPDGINENAYQEVYDRIVRPLLELRDTYNLCIVAVHHDRKASKDSDRSVRGSSAWENAADTLIAIERKESITKVSVTARNGGEATPYHMRFDPEAGCLVYDDTPVGVGSSAAETIAVLREMGGRADKNQLAKELGINPRAAKERLRRLVQDGYAKPDVPGKGTKTTIFALVDSDD